jgi:hypothetical protein
VTAQAGFEFRHILHGISFLDRLCSCSQVRRFFVVLAETGHHPVPDTLLTQADWGWLSRSLESSFVISMRDLTAAALLAPASAQ